MNIRDVELRTGLERANIRFYEKEGLLEPERRPNGYRDYSGENVETLLRIKLLRQLNISVAEIKQLQAEEAELQEVVTQRLEMIQQEKAGLARERRICETIRSEGISYEQLQAERYLEQLEELRRSDWELESGTTLVYLSCHLKEDVAPVDLRPEQRLMARVADLLIYHLIWLVVYYKVLQTPFSWNTSYWFHVMFTVLLGGVMEPTLLSCLGTTAGKWIIGMRVHTHEGEKLDWGQAVGRQLQVWWDGACMMSWRLYSVRVKYADYWPYNKEKGFPWDEETTYSFCDRKEWRFFAVVGSVVALLLAVNLVYTDARGLDHRGALTVSEFAENYNKYTDLHYNGAEYLLDAHGRWKEEPLNIYHVYWDDLEGSHEARFPEYVYQLGENGHLRGIFFEIYREGDKDHSIPTAKKNMLTVAMAYAGQGSDAAAQIQSAVNLHHMESYSFQVGDVQISWQVKTTGYYFDKYREVYVPVAYASDYTYSYHLIYEIKLAPQTEAQQ